MFLGRRKQLVWFLHSSSTWRANLNKCLVQPQMVCAVIRKSSQNTRPTADDARNPKAEKNAKNPLIGVVYLLTTGGLISVRRGARAERRGLLFPRPPLASLLACGGGRSLLSIDPANSTRKRRSSCVPSGNTSPTSPMMKLHGNHQIRCNGDTPVTMTAMIPRAKTSVAATRGGTTIAPLRSCRRTCTSCHSVHTMASTSTP